MAKSFLDYDGLSFFTSLFKNLINKKVVDNGVTTAGTGEAYTATVDGATALTAGISFVMIPHTVSTAVLPTLNVNGLGAKAIRRRVSNSTVTTVASASAGWLGANKPIRVTYDGTYWIADLDRPNANDIYGTVGIPNGGTGANTLSGIRTNLGIVTTVHNLLDNPDFRNPVNQRGVTGKSGRGVYTLDRWMIDSENGNGYFDVKPGVGIGLNVNGDSWMTFFQRVPGLDQNKQYTIAFMDGAGIIHVNESSDILWGNGYGDVRLILGSGTRTIVWAALYEGAYTADTLPEYQPKGYAAELLECMRYYQFGERMYATAVQGSVYSGRIFRVPMRVKPTVTIYDMDGNAGHVTFWNNSGTTSVAVDSPPVTTDGIYYVTGNTGISADGMVGYHYVANAEL